MNYNEIDRRQSLQEKWNSLFNYHHFLRIIIGENSPFDADKYMQELIKDPTKNNEVESILDQISNFMQEDLYRILRAKEYPEIGDQLDAIFKVIKSLKDAGVNISDDGNDYVAAIQSIKDKYPKP